MWKWAKGVQITSYEFLIAQDRHGKSTSQVAEKGGEREVLENQWIRANEEKLNSKYIKKNLLLIKDGCLRIAW